MADEKKKDDKKAKDQPKPKAPEQPKVADKKAVLEKAGDAINAFDASRETLETKLRGKVPELLDKEIGNVVQTRTKFVKAFQRGLTQYLHGVTDELGVVTAPHAEFGEGLRAAAYKAFGTALGIKNDDIKALGVTAKIGEKQPASAMAYRLLFQTMTGVDMEDLVEGYQDEEQILDDAVQQDVMKPLVEASTKYLLRDSADKMVAANKSNDKLTADITALCNIAGMKVNPKDMLTPNQRGQMYAQALAQVMSQYGHEYLPVYGKAGKKSEAKPKA
ncbi:MAG TPA: hypothetical protein HA362_04470 [Nanoarchaeota archaeon]|nr:hypothetical protein [Nanoarchaeota archaeon]